MIFFSMFPYESTSLQQGVTFRGRNVGFDVDTFFEPCCILYVPIRISLKESFLMFLAKKSLAIELTRFLRFSSSSFLLQLQLYRFEIFLAKANMPNFELFKNFIKFTRHLFTFLCQCELNFTGKKSIMSEKF